MLKITVCTDLGILNVLSLWRGKNQREGLGVREGDRERELLCQMN